MQTTLRMLFVAVCFGVAGWLANDAWSAYKAGEAVAQAGNHARPPASAPARAVAPLKAHNYEVKDGMEYGYTRELSADERAAGQAAKPVLMFRYAGERDGKYQVHASDGTTFTALECERPCRVIKLMRFVDSDYLRDKVHVERIAFQAGTVAAAVLEDALGGKLHQYGISRGHKAYQVWVDERAGRREIQVKAPAAPQ